jgi:hypothetical protein
MSDSYRNSFHQSIQWISLPLTVHALAYKILSEITASTLLYFLHPNLSQETVPKRLMVSPNHNPTLTVQHIEELSEYKELTLHTNTHHLLLHDAGVVLAHRGQ